MLAVGSSSKISSGSDASALETIAEYKDGKYTLNGRKRYMSFAHAADWGVVMAKTDPSKGARGISAFVIEKGTPGYSVIERVPTMGCRGHQDEEVLIENCVLPKEQLVGEEGRGLVYALSTLDETRTTLAAGFVGYFGRYLAMLILRRVHKGAKPEVEDAEPSAQIASNHVHGLEESKLKIEKKKIKQAAKQAKKTSKK